MPQFQGLSLQVQLWKYDRPVQTDRKMRNATKRKINNLTPPAPKDLNPSLSVQHVKTRLQGQ